MSAVFDTLCAEVAEAAKQQQPVRIVGGGSHSDIGFPGAKEAKNIDLKAFNAINFYSPEELVISAQAGVRLSELSALLAEQKQRFSCSFRNLSGVFGSHSDQATLGAGIALGLSGSDRVNHYAIRDSVLGMETINAEGQLIRMGGRVFKNVTGYDLSKLMIGSRGTLGIIASVNMRLRPLAEAEVSLCFDAPGVESAVAGMARALNSPFDVCGAYAEQTGGGYRVILRLEGFAASVQERAERLKTLFHDHKPEVMENALSYKKWLKINNLNHFPAELSSEEVWLLSQPASRAPKVVQALQAVSPQSRMHLDWGGAQVWCATTDGLSAFDILEACQGLGVSLQPIRVAAERAKGALVMDTGSRKLIQKLYQEFDPQNIFQRQRLYDNL